MGGKSSSSSEPADETSWRTRGPSSAETAFVITLNVLSWSSHGFLLGCVFVLCFLFFGGSKFASADVDVRF